MSEAGPAAVDVRERGAGDQAADRRLFVTFRAWGGVHDSKALIAALESAGVEGALYADLHDARGVGAVILHEDPAYFVTRLRDVLAAEPFGGLESKPALTMVGRTYASGFEPDLLDWLLARPRRTILDPASPWAIWYPLRRTGAFARLTPAEQATVLREHGALGRTYGDAGLAHDIRLACHGLDAADNDFVIGLIGRELHPLSHLVQAMRRTAQTSQYLERLGPFFVGHALWRYAGR